ncbi:MAG: hypothetical protein HY301_16560 [Verrucomicrobia bacterium]|nr:hypothetical protein [Verrucomicrobiota bacterium]
MKTLLVFSSLTCTLALFAAEPAKIETAFGVTLGERFPSKLLDERTSKPGIVFYFFTPEKPVPPFYTFMAAGSENGLVATIEASKNLKQPAAKESFDTITRLLTEKYGAPTKPPTPEKSQAEWRQGVRFIDLTLKKFAVDSEYWKLEIHYVDERLAERTIKEVDSAEKKAKKAKDGLGL